MRGNGDGPVSSARDFNVFDDLTPVRRYKLLLQTFIKRRESGTAQAIAEGLGVTRGYISQITSPAYELPIPGNQVSNIIALAGLSSKEEHMFLAAYLEAHPDRASDVVESFDMKKHRVLPIPIPVLTTEVAQSRMERLIRTVAQEIIASMTEGDASRSQRAGRNGD